ncbi:MAG TPA: hypothetical protein VF035_04160 [Longimicrobiales bacterium]
MSTIGGGGGKVLTPQAARTPSPAGSATGQMAGWTVLGRFGVVLAIIGLADFALVFYPGHFGEPTWEFAAVDAAFSSLPVFTIGLALMAGAGLAKGFVKRTRAIAVMCLMLAAVIVGLMLLYATNIPLAVRMSPPEVLPGIYKSIVRTVLMGVVFGAGFVTAGVTAWRRTRK